MKFSIFFVTFSTIFILKSSLSRSIALIHDQKLSKSICKITNDIISSRIDTQDILIGNIGGHVWSLTVNDIVKCISKGNAVLVTDLRRLIKERNLRKASVVILALNQANEVSLVYKSY